MTRNYDETLDILIAKAKKSWEGVDVERYMSDLRDDSFDKEVAENLSKEVASYITEQMKSNMDKVTIKCRDLMVGDWITNRNGFPMQITNVGDDYAYATFEGNEGDPWEFDDKDDQPEPIPLTPEIMKKNGFWEMENVNNGAEEYIVYAIAGLTFHYNRDNDYYFPNTPISWKYVHQLQHALRLCGLDELADNFKV